MVTEELVVLSQWMGFLRLITSTGQTEVGLHLFLQADLPVSPRKLGTRYGEAAGIELGGWAMYLGAKIWAAWLKWRV